MKIIGRDAYQKLSFDAQKITYLSTLAMLRKDGSLSSPYDKSTSFFSKLVDSLVYPETSFLPSSDSDPKSRPQACL